VSGSFTSGRKKTAPLTSGPDVSAREKGKESAAAFGLTGLDELGSAHYAARASGEKADGPTGGEEMLGLQPKPRKGKFLSPFLFLIFQIYFQMIFEIIFFLK
jgi:hypothetical protein